MKNVTLMEKMSTEHLEQLSGGVVHRIGEHYLDDCTGELYNILGLLVYEYPGDWSGGEGC